MSCLILDHHMPETTGLELARIIRSHSLSSAATKVVPPPVVRTWRRAATLRWPLRESWVSVGGYGTGDGRGGSPAVQTVRRGKRASISVKIA
jgi:hypothetical protein